MGPHAVFYESGVKHFVCGQPSLAADYLHGYPAVADALDRGEAHMMCVHCRDVLQRELARQAAQDGQVDPGHDSVNHPSHYTSHPSGVECIQITEHMTFCAGNAVKYLWRAGLKDSDQGREKQIEDLRKAAWYATREADRLERENG